MTGIFVGDLGDPEFDCRGAHVSIDARFARRNLNGAPPVDDEGDGGDADDDEEETSGGEEVSFHGLGPVSSRVGRAQRGSLREEHDICGVDRHLKCRSRCSKDSRMKFQHLQFGVPLTLQFQLGRFAKEH